jgi:hypothetical protein
MRTLIYMHVTKEMTREAVGSLDRPFHYAVN